MLLGSSYAWGEEGTSDLDRAEYWFRRAALSKDPFIVRMIDSYYQATRHAAADVRAVPWFERAAAKGDADAHGDLGEMYLKGEGRAVNYPLALQHLTVAGKQGLPKAQFHLGMFYRDGHGTDQDPELARQWFEMSAQNNNANAAFSLSAMYLGGELKARDGITQAYSWYVQGPRAQGLNPSVLTHQKLRPSGHGQS